MSPLGATCQSPQRRQQLSRPGGLEPSVSGCPRSGSTGRSTHPSRLFLAGRHLLLRPSKPLESENAEQGKGQAVEGLLTPGHAAHRACGALPRI